MAPKYREYPAPAGLGPLVACTWEHEPAEHHIQRVIPDGCVDLIWLAERQLVVAGPDTGPHEESLPAGMRSSGLRLRPGAAGAVLGLPASELRDQQVALEAIWADRATDLAGELATVTPRRRIELLVHSVAQRGARPDSLIGAAARLLAHSGARITSVAAELGVSERTLHRRMLAGVGYGPKVLARVARLRRLVALPNTSLASRADLAGYASQAHMNDEVRRLTGSTAARFLEDAVLTSA